MKYFLIILIFLFSSGGFASSTRSIEADSITSSDKTKTFNLPASSTTLLGALSGDVTTSGNVSTIGASKVTNSMLAGSIDLTTKVTGTLPISNGGTGSSTQNFVDLSSIQSSISGAKTFVSTLTAPALIATSYNGNTITTGTGILTLGAGKTLTVSNSITLAGTDSTTMTFPTTSATIARTDAGNTFTGHQTIEGVTSTGATGSGKFVFDTSPVLITPNLGTPSAAVLTNATQIPIATQMTRDSFSGNSSTTIFTLSNTPPSNTQVQIYLDGLLQITTTDYSISGTTLTFVTAPATGQNIIAIYSRY